MKKEQNKNTSKAGKIINVNEFNQIILILMITVTLFTFSCEIKSEMFKIPIIPIPRKRFEIK